jgi:hypothetical protein
MTRLEIAYRVLYLATAYKDETQSDLSIAAELEDTAKLIRRQRVTPPVPSELGTLLRQKLAEKGSAV